MTTMMKQVLTPALQKSALSSIRTFYPTYDSMTEGELDAIVDQLTRAKAQHQCRYTGAPFSEEHDNHQVIMVDSDGTIKVGVKKYMEIRAARDNSVCEYLNDVLRTIGERMKPVYAERERRRKLVEPIMDLSRKLRKINAVDFGEHASERDFGADLTATALRLKHTHEALKFYFAQYPEDLPKPAPATEPEAPAAALNPTDLPEGTHAGPTDEDVYLMVGELAEAVSKKFLDFGAEPDAKSGEFDAALQERVVNAHGSDVWRLYEIMVLDGRKEPFTFNPGTNDEAVDLTRPVVDRAATESTFVGTVAEHAPHPADGSTA